jgi:hypothetical protein
MEYFAQTSMEPPSFVTRPFGPLLRMKPMPFSQKKQGLILRAAQPMLRGVTKDVTGTRSVQGTPL